MISLIGIDPGVNGAIAWVDFAGKLTVWDMPTFTIVVSGNRRRVVDPYKLVDIFRSIPDTSTAYVEQVGARPGQGVTSMFNMGKGLGTIHGALAGLRIQRQDVTPQAWKGFYEIDGDKDTARALARNMFPDSVDLFEADNDDGRAEAALIAMYGRQRFMKLLGVA